MPSPTPDTPPPPHAAQPSRPAGESERGPDRPPSAAPDAPPRPRITDWASL